ncbi:MAG TPA: 3-dehydroquinate synthase family protein [Acidobacteriota bacterium]|nr:3-dehydroquinate synthase family protein [Acidobacteriota bacterium]
MALVRVKLQGRSYPIEIGTANAAALSRQVARHLESDRLFAFYDAQFYVLHGPRLRAQLPVSPGRLAEMVIPGGEASKSRAVLGRIYDFLLDQGVSRSDVILACGGGVTTDLIGYAAATTLRGVRWAAVPTTLLGMVDAAIGGKTGINHSRGKNLIGAFWQPVFVHCDVAYLQTLAPRHMVAGIGEVIKYAGLIGRPMVGKLKPYLSRAELYREKDLASLVRLAARYKADMVSRDERETGARAVLNFGHTFGHGIERAVGFGRLLHGEAVILGILAALELGELYQLPVTDGVREYRKIVESAVGLVRKLHISADTIMNGMKLDKKRRGGKFRFVLLARPGRPIIASDVNYRLITKAVKRMLAFYESQGGRNAHHPSR